MRQLTKQLSWRNFAQLFLAGCINAFGVTVFLAPVRLYDSGISGTAILLSQLTPLPPWPGRTCCCAPSLGA